MKKMVITLIIIGCSFSSKAQKAKIIGSWLITKVELPTNTQYPFKVIEFSNRGRVLMESVLIATWRYNIRSNEIQMRSNIKKDFNGMSKILSSTNKELVLEKEGIKTTYLKLDLNKIAKENAMSKLKGAWKLENDFDDIQLLKMELPDVFSLTTISSKDSIKSTTNGTWMYNSDEKSITFIGESELLKGKSTLKEQSENVFVLNLNGKEIIAKKEVSSTNLERLIFNIDNFPARPNENPPWLDFNALLVELEHVNYLKYKQSRLIPNTTSFKQDTLLSKININKKRKSITVNNLIITEKDTLKGAESFKGGFLNMTNDFFPQEKLGPFRVITTETIKVIAGEFECKVVEGFYGEVKLKYWMIINKPGVFAKVIREDIDAFNNVDYSITELIEIK
ncbi:hypothetical protein [Polaribacter sp. Q13]|uniref:hypothetical protein n=1 Tax=Polaribacter sp. Q13 TaxID=2806551 RepID=UPI00193C3C1E|nr:hypothetical protein [Polaribacter sp. Q13]QVY65149.1 hypothetical protein JOP69_15565 [Polaribacter sp. Q13]